MSSQIARQVITAFKESKDLKTNQQEFELSPREKEVINLLAGGNNYQQIADQLYHKR